MPLIPYMYDQNISSPSFVMRLRNVSNTRILWELPGGVLAIEMDWSGTASDAYNFYQTYLGYRIILMDESLIFPVAEGWVFGIAIAPFGCRILCKGAWQRHFDEFDDTAYDISNSTSTLIKASLTNFVPVINSDQSNIDETTTAGTAGTWDLSEYGLYPGDLITKLAAVSNENLNQWNYWVQSAPLNNILPQKPIAYFKEQVDDGTFNWQINKRDLGAGGFTQERNIDELANEVIVIYRDIAGEQGITSWATDTDSQSMFWTKQIILTGGEMATSWATQYRDLMLSKLKNPLLRRSSVITSKYIMDDKKQQWPLWYVIKNGGGYLRINDLYPESALFGESHDTKRIGQIMTAEYNDAAYALSISLDTTDEGADAMLAQIQTFL